MTAAAVLYVNETTGEGIGELLSSKGIEVRRESGESRWYIDPETNAELNSVTTVLGATTSKPWLVAWAAKLAAEFAVEQHTLVGSVIAEAGTPAAVALVKGAAQARREEARERGTFVHDIVEALILDTPLPDFTDQPDIAPFASAFIDWCIEWQPRFLAAEATVANPRDGWAGTLDIIAYLPSLGAVHEIDVKTGENLDSDMIVQVGTYKEATEVWLPLGRKVPMPKVDGCSILHIRPGRARLVDVTDQVTPDTYVEFLERLALLRRYDVRPRKIGTVRYPLQPDGTPGSPYLEDLGVVLWDKLRQHGIVTLADLATQTAADLRSVDGIGPKRVDAYRDILALHHLTLKGEA